MFHIENIILCAYEYVTPKYIADDYAYYIIRVCKIDVNCWDVLIEMCGYFNK